MRKNKDAVSGRILSPEFMLEDASIAVTVTNREQQDVDDGWWHFSDSPFDAR